MSSRLAAAAVDAGGSFGLPALGLLAVMEAGVPIPVPFDLLVLLVGERARAGRFPLWLGALGLELVAIVGTTTLFLLCRGPGRALAVRLAAKVGLGEERLGRASALVERRGRSAMFVGRATPGLRTVTVVGAGASGVSTAVALPALILGSSVFLQLHLVLGYALGRPARQALEHAKGPVIAVIALVALGGIAVWLVRRGRRAGVQASSEGCCPVCIGLGLLVPSALGLHEVEPERSRHAGGH